MANLHGLIYTSLVTRSCGLGRTSDSGLAYHQSSFMRHTASTNGGRTLKKEIIITFPIYKIRSSYSCLLCHSADWHIWYHLGEHRVWTFTVLRIDVGADRDNLFLEHRVYFRSPKTPLTMSSIFFLGLLRPRRCFKRYPKDSYIHPGQPLVQHSYRIFESAFWCTHVLLYDISWRKYISEKAKANL